jgi:hypothetical protein
MHSVVTEGEKAQVWIPYPTWVIPNRPFNPAPGLGDAKPFNLPPLYHPTSPPMTPVMPEE